MFNREYYVIFVVLALFINIYSLIKIRHLNIIILYAILVFLVAIILFLDLKYLRNDFWI